MKKQSVTKPIFVSLVCASLFAGGCASHSKKTAAPAPLESEIRSIEEQKQPKIVYHPPVSSKSSSSHSAGKEKQGRQTEVSSRDGAKEKTVRKTAGKKTYVVKKGDSLWLIAKKYGVSSDALIKANNIKNAKSLKVGQKLTIPASGK